MPLELIVGDAVAAKRSRHRQAKGAGPDNANAKFLAHPKARRLKGGGNLGRKGRVVEEGTKPEARR
jgi:hypothetical protein